MGNIQSYLNQIKNAVFGKDVRKSIHDAIKQCYDDAAVNHDNANMEVKLARGTHETLNDRITENEKNQENLSSQLDTNTSRIDSVNGALLEVDNKKADKTHIWSMANMGQDIKEAFTGGAVAVVGPNSVLTENVVDDQITFAKRTHSGGNMIFYVDKPFDFDTTTRKLINKSYMDYFGLNYGGGHNVAAKYYFSELQLNSSGYIWFNPKLNGEAAFIVNNTPDDMEHCILFGAYSFAKKYFYLNGVDFTVNSKPYIEYLYDIPYKYNTLTGEFAMVFSINEPNFDTQNNKLIINKTCGVETRKGHFNNKDQELLLTGNGYIGYDTTNREYVCITTANFIPNESIVLLGYYSTTYKKYYLNGNFLIDGKKQYEEYSYSKVESNKLIEDSISKLKQGIVQKTNSVILYENTLKTQEKSEFLNVENIEASDKGFKFIKSGYIVLNKNYSIEQRKTSINFIIGQNGILSFFYKTYYGYNLAGSLFTVDAQNNKIIIHEQFPNLDSIPAERVSTTFNFVIGREYNLSLIKEKRKNIMVVTDMVTGISKSIETDCTAVIGDLINEFAGGRQNGKFGIWNRQGTENYISNLYITTKLKEPLLYITGDSICEGDRCKIGYRYSDKCEEVLGKDNVAISGMSGTQITHVLDRLKNELPFIKPKYCMVTIGTNGGNTTENIQELLNYIESLNIIPILNHVSQTSNNSANNINILLDAFSKYIGCKFDIATSINNDITQYYDSSLYGDTVHPNELGNEKMFERFKIDVPYLIY